MIIILIHKASLNLQAGLLPGKARVLSWYCKNAERDADNLIVVKDGHIITQEEAGEIITPLLPGELYELDCGIMDARSESPSHYQLFWKWHLNDHENNN